MACRPAESNLYEIPSLPFVLAVPARAVEFLTQLLYFSQHVPLSGALGPLFALSVLVAAVDCPYRRPARVVAHPEPLATAQCVVRQRIDDRLPHFSWQHRDVAEYPRHVVVITDLAPLGDCHDCEGCFSAPRVECADARCAFGGQRRQDDWFCRLAESVDDVSRTLSTDRGALFDGLAPLHLRHPERMYTVGGGVSG